MSSFKYYLRHPIKLIKLGWYNLKDTLHRKKYGWANPDVWEMYEWLLKVLPQILYRLALNRSYPTDFSDYEEWKKWLIDKAMALEKCREANIENEYYKDFMAILMKNDRESDEHKELCRKYYDREHEIWEERKKLVQETFADLGKHFFDLWS